MMEWWESGGERSLVIGHWSLVAAWMHGCMDFELGIFLNQVIGFQILNDL
jgi:hypothetical protein